jgi:hypothetical protein
MSVTKFANIAAFAILMASSGAGLTADNELYDAPPPDDAAFLRWIESGKAPEIFGISALGAEGDVFHPVSAANTEGAEVGAYYTAALSAKGDLVIIEEPERADRSKVQLTLLNLTGEAVRLVLLEQNADVVVATAPNQAGARAVNPVAAILSVVTAEDEVLGTFDVRLRRGQNVTFVARPDGAQLIENRFGPNIEG